MTSCLQTVCYQNSSSLISLSTSSKERVSKVPFYGFSVIKQLLHTSVPAHSIFASLMCTVAGTSSTQYLGPQPQFGAGGITLHPGLRGIHPSELHHNARDFSHQLANLTPCARACLCLPPKHKSQVTQRPLQN